MKYMTASPDRYLLLREFARKNRQNATEAENVLWRFLRQDALGVKFVRQHIIKDYIVDFLAPNEQLVVEVDGAYHAERQQMEDDELRSQELEKMGYKVIRFSNEEVMFDTANTLNKIKDALHTSSPLRGGKEGSDVVGVCILAIESSCDDTSAAVIKDGYLLSNVTASQAVHEQYGGVVPELASRAHQQNIVPVVDAALKNAGVKREELSAIAFTRGPGLMGSLLVGVSFAKGLAASLGIPMIDVNHLQGHVLAHFIKEQDPPQPSLKGRGDSPNPTHNISPLRGGEEGSPSFPFLCLLVSGGNSQIIKVNAYNDMQIIGQTIDDAAGEAIDKAAKVMGLGYPGGPIIDKLARKGNADAYKFSKPHIQGYDYSFSGLKTSFLYNLRDWLKDDPDFIEHHKEDLAASYEKAIVDTLMNKLRMAAKDLKIKDVAVAGGVSANTALRQAFIDYGKKYHWRVYIPKFGYTTDNAAMIAQAGWFKYHDKDFCPMEAPAFSRVTV